MFTGQWADRDLVTLLDQIKAFGYDGVELACWGDHFEVAKAADPETGDAYCASHREKLEKAGLRCEAISAHLVGQAVCDRIDDRHRSIIPESIWGDGDGPGVQQRAAEEMKRTARAAKAFGVKIVNGFTGSAIWPFLYSFPPVPPEMIEEGYLDFANRWNPILDVFGECGVKFALEVHPTEIAFDIPTAERTLKAIGSRPEFGFNFDPSHLIWQGIDPVEFIRAFPERIYHVHVKDAKRNLNGRNGILGGHLEFGDHRRGWDFKSPGRGEIDFNAITCALNDIGYEGPLSVEWEDPHMDQDQGAAEAAEFLNRIDFSKSRRAFDAAFDA